MRSHDGVWKSIINTALSSIGKWKWDCEHKWERMQKKWSAYARFSVYLVWIREHYGLGGIVGQDDGL